MSTWVLVCTEEYTWYLVHEKAILPIRAHPWNSTVSPGYQLIVLSVVIGELPFFNGLSCLASSSLELVPAPSTGLLTSTWHTRAQFGLLLPPVGCFLTTTVQPVLCYKWNRCSRPQVISWVSMAQIIILKHCTACCLPGTDCSLLRWKMHWHSCGCRREREVRVEMSRSWRRRRRKSGWELSCQGRCRPSS